MVEWTRNFANCGDQHEQGSGQGAAQDIAGKIQEQGGKLVGSKEQQAKGLEKQLEGKLQQNAGDLKEAIKDAGKY